jgi:hypothetical protein
VRYVSVVKKFHRLKPSAQMCVAARCSAPARPWRLFCKRHIKEPSERRSKWTLVYLRKQQT